MKRNWKSQPILLLLALGAIAITISWHTTSTGVGLAPDSYVYLASARSLLEGDGIRIPIGPEASLRPDHFPPLFAGLLAAASFPGFDPQEAARWLNALLFGANVCLAGWAIWKLAGGRWLAAGLGAAVLLSSPGMLEIHAHVWSEPAFFFFSILGLLGLSTRTLEPFRRGWLGPALAISLAFLLRYAGAALLATGFASLLVFSERSWRTRLRPALVFTALGGAPLVFWLILNLGETGRLANRALTFHPVDLPGLRRGLETMGEWVFPWLSAGTFGSAGSAILQIAGLALLAGLLIWTVIQLVRAQKITQPGEPPRSPALPFALFAVVYLGFILLSMSIIDAQTSLDTRILSPMFVAVVVVLGVDLLPRLGPARTAKTRAAWVMIAVLLAGYLAAGWGVVGRLHAGEGKGYAGVEWSRMSLLQQVSQLPPGIPIFSNGHDLIYLLTGRPAASLPQEISPNSLRLNFQFEAQVEEMGHNLVAGRGVMVYFNGLEARRWYLPSEAELMARLPLTRISHWRNEGSLYRLNK